MHNNRPTRPHRGRQTYRHDGHPAGHHQSAPHSVQQYLSDPRFPVGTSSPVGFSQGAYGVYPAVTAGAVAALALSSFSHLNIQYETASSNYGYPHAQTNALGYTLSSTYVPSLETAPASLPARAFESHAPRRPTGSHKCTYNDCQYIGSAQDLKIHRMDRHLLFPDGWEDQTKKRKREDEPAVPIPGTGILLDTPEALNAWLAERKSRWPSARRVDEKARAREDARMRGELQDDGPRKRGRGRGFDRGRARASVAGGRGRGSSMPAGRGNRERARGVDRGWPTRQPPRRQEEPSPSSLPGPRVGPPLMERASIALGLDGYHSERSLTPYSDPSSASEDSDSDSGSDMDPVADALSSRAPRTQMDSDHAPEPSLVLERIKLSPTRIFRAHPAAGHRQERGPRDLVRALLATDIKATVSRLSQAIRFLVDNDCLEGVEESVGDPGTAAPVVLLEDREAGMN